MWKAGAGNEKWGRWRVHYLIPTAPTSSKQRKPFLPPPPAVVPSFSLPPAAVADSAAAAALPLHPQQRAGHSWTVNRIQADNQCFGSSTIRHLHNSGVSVCGPRFLLVRLCMGTAGLFCMESDTLCWCHSTALQVAADDIDATLSFVGFLQWLAIHHPHLWFAFVACRGCQMTRGK